MLRLRHLVVGGVCALLAAPGAAAAAPEDDQFDGTALDTTRWNRILNFQDERLDVSGGMLRIETVNADIDGPNPNYPSPIENFVLQTPRAGDWTVETKVHAPLQMQFQLAGFMLYSDDNHYVKYDVVADNTSGNAPDIRVELRKEEGGPLTGTGEPDPDPPASAGNIWWLRLTKQGNTYSGAISADGVNWEQTPGTVTIALDNPALGLMATGPDQQSPVTASFDYFRYVVDDDTAPTTTAALNPAQPGPGGTYTGPVEVTLSATDGDDGSGVAETEFRVDGGGWTPYEGPFTVSGNGRHVVEYRSTDEEGNVEDVKQLAFTIAPDSGQPPPQPGPGPGTPPPSGGTPPPAPPVATRLGTVPRRIALRSFLRRGLRVRLACGDAAVSGRLSLTVARRVARRAGLRGTLLARRSVRCAGGERLTITLRPSRAVRRALGDERRAMQARLGLRLSSGEGTSRRVTLRA